MEQEQTTKYCNRDYPQHIKENFIYRFCYNNVYTKDLNASFVIIGRPGTGKSTLGLKICYDLDPTFTTERIVYSVEDLLVLLGKKGNEKLKPGATILFDEVVNEAGSYSRRALSRHNQTMNFVVANMRARRLILILCVPKFSQLDKDVRETDLSGVFQMIKIDRVKKKSKAKFKWRDPDEWTDKMKDPFPRLKDKESQKKKKVVAVWFGKPPKDLEIDYKQKKEKYMEEKIEKWLHNLTNDRGEAKLTHARDIAKEILKNPQRYQTFGKFDYVKILANFEVGDQKARNIVKTAETLSASVA